MHAVADREASTGWARVETGADSVGVINPISGCMRGALPVVNCRFSGHKTFPIIITSEERIERHQPRAMSSAALLHGTGSRSAGPRGQGHPRASVTGEQV